jgi:thioredoxin-dependent peroxiredoxin
MNATNKGKKVVAKTGKVAPKAMANASQTAAMKEKKLAAQKDALIKKLKEELKAKEKSLQEGKKSLLGKAKETFLEMKEKVDTQAKETAAKMAGQKESLIQKLKSELAEKEEIIRENIQILRETAESAGKEVTAFKEKTTQSLNDLKAKAETEAKKLKNELEAKSEALRGKMNELEAYRKSAEENTFELQAKVKELTAKMAGAAEKERAGSVTFKGNSLTLLGREIRVGDRAPDFRVIDNGMKPATLENFKGKIKIVCSVPSLDTPVCSTETHRFNEEAGKLPENVAVLTISMDLPFAQSRWCAAAGIDKVKTFSDYQDRSFALAYGVLIKELRLLSRAVFIVDPQDIVRYMELVPEITNEPDYERVLSAARALL